MNRYIYKFEFCSYTFIIMYSLKKIWIIDAMWIYKQIEKQLNGETNIIRYITFSYYNFKIENGANMLISIFNHK